jgi:putative CocE/NonD family hydrolase
MWMNRLEHEPFMVIPWLEHPHRVPYWKHGSVCEDYTKIDAPTLVVGGWNDAYSNAVPRLMKSMRCTRKAIIGPWIHKYPHLTPTGPAIGFLQECLRWWDQHLKGQSTGVSRDPDFRYYVMEPWTPGTAPDTINGRWLGDSFWGFGHVETRKWWLNANGIGPTAGSESPRSISSQQTTGANGGDFVIIGPDGFAGDQRSDDAQSITFDTPALVTDIDIVGQPAVELDFSADKPVTHVCVRLNDVWPSGEVSRITYHLQNLCFRDSREYPMPLEPGKRYKMKIKLDDIAWRLPKGHRLRVAISTSYFPMMWPAPEPVTLTVYAGKSQLHLPLRKEVANENAVTWPEAQAAARAEMAELRPPSHSRRIETDETTGELRIEIARDHGEQELAPHGMITHSASRESHSILPDDPLSAKMETHWTEERRRGTWNARTETYGRMTVTKTHWVIWGKIEAFEGKKKVFEKEFAKEIPRLLQ